MGMGMPTSRTDKRRCYMKPTRRIQNANSWGLTWVGCRIRGYHWGGGEQIHENSGRAGDKAFAKGLPAVRRGRASGTWARWRLDVAWEGRGGRENKSTES